MNLAHIHLLLNHFPTIGFAIGLSFFVGALVSKSRHVNQLSLVIFFLIAAVAIPTYMTGNAAELKLCPAETCPPDVSVTSIRAHEDAALLAFVFMEITGFVAWLGLWQMRRIPGLPGWNSLLVLLASVVAFGFMARAAAIGQEIRHPEILVQSVEGEVVASPAGPSGMAQSIGAVVSGATGNSWLWPASETLHFVGLCLLFTVVLLVDLRILGMAKSWSFASLYQLLPLGMLGFALNLATGMLFFLGKPSQYIVSSAQLFSKAAVFDWKIIFVVLGGLNVLYFTLFEDVWKLGPGDNASLRTKFAAASAILVWLGVLICGHMLPFWGIAF